jgi:hypothetical protein
MSKKNNNGAPALDLGLEALLSQSAAAPTGALEGQSGEKLPTAIFTLDDDAGELHSEFSQLAQSRQWGVLVSKAESAIASDEDWEARLWWIRGHLGALTLPVSLLAAPFETICRQLETRGELGDFAKSLVVEIGAMMLDRLKAVGDRRQEHAVRVAMQSLGLLESSTSDRSSRSRTPTIAPRFELGAPVNDVAMVVPNSADEPRQPHKPRYIALGLALALLLVVGVGVWWQRSLLAGEVQGVAESWVVSHAELLQQPPQLEARPVSSNLGALFYSLSESTTPPVVEQRPVAPGAPSAVTATVERPTVPRLPSDKPAPAAQSGTKESVNTDGPLEGQEFRRGVERSGSARAPRLPEAIPDQSGRSFPDTVSPDAASPDAVTLPPSDVKSVLVTTNVVAAPSYGARIIARLRAGDRVAVEGRVGSWFRIRSRRGKPGFVFAQDLGEGDDFVVQDPSQQP